MDMYHFIMAIRLINISDDNTITEVDEYKLLKLLISKHLKMDDIIGETMWLMHKNEH